MADKTKAELFQEYVEANHPQVFGIQKGEDEAHTVVFRSRIEAEGQQLPTAIFIDDTIYTMIRVLLAENVLNDDNRAQVLEYINEQNRSFKVFKYTADADGGIYLDSCLPFLDDKFSPELIIVILNVILAHLTEDGHYKKLMQQVWVTK